MKPLCFAWVGILAAQAWMHLKSIQRLCGCEPRPRQGPTDQRVFIPSSEGRQARMMTRPLFFTVLGLFAAVSFLSPAFAGQSSDATLRRVQAKAGQVQSIQAKFTQEKKLSIVKKPLVSQGIFAFQRPKMLRWEYLSPVRSGFVVNGDAGTRWNELSGETKNFTVQKDPVMQIVSDQILLWTTLDLDALSKMFQIDVESDSPAVLRLTRHEGEQSPIRGIRITFAPDDSSIAAIEILENDNDSTTLRFYDTQLNAPLDPALFARK